MTNAYELTLHGCAPTPLAHYLKGLGILRVVTAADTTARAAWRGEALVLTSRWIGPHC